ncbi:MAG: hypothetical protein IT158_01240 [Bryobacterales bacterium]|nr:hypothetical protein [Bryobacterales bacterium]
MRRTITVLALAAGLSLVAGAGRCLPHNAGGRFAKYSAALGSTDVGVNPLQRFFLSLVLAQTEPRDDNPTM